MEYALKIPVNISATVSLLLIKVIFAMLLTCKNFDSLASFFCKVKNITLKLDDS